MKKILLILLVLFVLVSVCSCQNNSHDTGRSGNDSNIDSETADPKDTGEYYHTDAETYSVRVKPGILFVNCLQITGLLPYIARIRQQVRLNSCRRLLRKLTCL